MAGDSLMLADSDLIAALPRLRYLARLWRCPEPDDLVQMTCDRALRFRDRFTEGSATAWLTTMMRRLLVNGYRDAARQPPIFELGEDDSLMNAPQETAVLLHEIGDMIDKRAGWSVLPMSVRGDSYSEMSEATGWPVAMVRSRLHHARIALRALGVALVLFAGPVLAHPKSDPLAEWYSSLRANDGSSCCDLRDCSPSDARLSDGAWEVPVGDGTWEAVPPEKVLRVPNRDGRAILCKLPSGVILCFVPASES